MNSSEPNSGYTRREAFRLGLSSLAAVWFSGPIGSALGQSTSESAPAGPYTLPPLPYSYEALEPQIDTLTMQIHHDKHHKAYVDNANKLLAGQPELAKLSPADLLKNLRKAPEAIRTGLRNNVGGHVNHSLFWQMMSPEGGGKPSGEIAKAIEKEFKSFDEFQKRFNDAALKRFGSVADGLLEQMPKEISKWPRTASQAILSELLGKGLARRGVSGCVASAGQALWGLTRLRALPETPRRCHHFGYLFRHLLWPRILTDPLGSLHFSAEPGGSDFGVESPWSQSSDERA